MAGQEKKVWLVYQDYLEDLGLKEIEDLMECQEWMEDLVGQENLVHKV